MSINFRNKISKQRSNFTSNNDQALTDEQKIDKLRTAFESDRGRIINSAPIRRLQQKTQVFPLERNAAVRSRLTHSMEVQQVGRFIVQSIVRDLKYKDRGKPESQKDQYGFIALERPIESLIEMACLMHDIGNPPFGHSGEAAINRWFTNALKQIAPLQAIEKSKPAADFWKELSTELQNFEGNAQGIRIVSSLQAMNLTYTQSACIMKYTRQATIDKSKIVGDFSYLMKKPGYYYTEREFIAQQNQALEIAPYHRHPLAYIMEAADDISYCLADIEDAVEKGILSLEQVSTLLKEEFMNNYPEGTTEQDTPKLPGFKYGKSIERTFADIIDEAIKQTQKDEVNKVYEYFIALRVGIIHPLVQHAARQFVTHIEQVYHGNFNRALLEDGSHYHNITKTFKAVAVKNVFNDKEVELLEIQGFKIISGLLDSFLPLLQLSSADFNKLLEGSGRGMPLEQRLVKKLPQKYILNYKKTLKNSYLPTEDLTESDIQSMNEVYERYLRCRLLQDHIANMTDNFASDEYKALVLCQ